MGRSRAANAKAIARVEADGPVPVAELVTLAGTPEASIVRWIVTGQGGVHLDGIKREGKWYSSPQAVFRYLAEVSRDREARAWDAGEEVSPRRAAVSRG